jgi:hypothetical protein
MDIFDKIYDIDIENKNLYNIKNIYLIQWYNINGNDKVLYSIAGNVVQFPKYIMYLMANSCKVKLKYLIFIKVNIIKGIFINLVYLIEYDIKNPLYCGRIPLYYCFMKYDKHYGSFTPIITIENKTR